MDDDDASREAASVYADDAKDPEAAEGGEAEPADEAPAPDDDYQLDDRLSRPDPAGVVVRYGGEDFLDEAVPTRADLISEAEKAAIRRNVDGRKKLLFMPSDVVETNEYRDGVETYVLRLYGALMSGEKAEVTVTDVEVFFDVRIPDDPPGGPAAFERELRSLIAAEMTEPGRGGRSAALFAQVEAYPIRGYRTAPCKWWRLSFATLQQRKKALAAVLEARSASGAAAYETASDDRSSYYRKVAREQGLPLSDWAALEGYEATPGPTAASPRCAYIVRVPVAGYRPLVDPWAPPAQREAAAAFRDRTPLLARDRTLILGWDIETHSSRGQGDVPDAARPGDEAFMICLSAHWKDDPEPLAQVCLVDVASAPDSRWTTVVCGSPANVLKALALAVGGLAPDVIAGFNDSGYDWPFVVERARQLDLLGWMWNAMSASPRRTSTSESVHRWSYQADKRIKIGPEESIVGSYLRVPGCVAIDVRVCFKKLYPKSETPRAGSLKFYLEVCGLKGKADMPIRRMWRYYEAARAAAALPAADPGRPAAIAAAAACMREVADYCRIDAMRCPELLVQRGVVADYREVSSLAFVALADSHYYAGGMKVCNLLGAYAWRRNILVSMVPRPVEETGQYPGAYVFPPEKGLSPDPDHLAAVEGAADALRTLEGAAREGVGSFRGAASEAALTTARKVLARALAAFAGDRPVTGLDFSSLYPSIIMTYNLSPEKILLTEGEAARWAAEGLALHKIEFPYNGRQVQGWSIKHQNDPAQFGLYPTVLLDLFNKRAEMKKVLGVHAAVKELIEVVDGRAKKDGSTAAAAARAVLRDAEAELEQTSAALAPDAPAPRVPPGATLAEVLADLKRRQKNAREQAEGVRRLLTDAAGAPRDDRAVQEHVAAEYAVACFKWTCANSKQNALKGYMNSYYGETGNPLSPFFLLELAGGVTSAGQYNIKAVADFVRSKGFLIKYGDSVTGDTALIVRRAGVICTARIDELVPDGGWGAYGEKESAVVPGLEVWQDGGFTPVHRVIRHACDKPIVRVLTHTGVVDCTTDHSLLRHDGTEVSPGDVRLGDPLLHADDTDLIRQLDAHTPAPALGAIGPDEAWAMGLFAAEGSCGVYRYGAGAARTVKYSWAINNQDLDLLVRAAECLPFPTKILDTMRSSGVYKLVPVGDIKGPALRYRTLFYNEHREKRIPPEILGAEFDSALEFWLGFYAGDGARAEQLRQTSWRVDQKGKEVCAGLWLLARRLGWTVTLNDRTDKPDVFRLTCADAQPYKRARHAVKKIRPIVPAGDDVVYDLETGSHHFHVGPGDLVVHNTDSLYLVPPSAVFAECDAEYAAGALSREAWWEAMVRITMRSLNAIRDEVNAFLKADNGSGYLKMAYEEVLYPVVFTGKKKYFGIPHLNEVNFRPSKLFVKGIDVVKQGQPGLAREIGHRIMWACVALDNRRGVRQIVEDVLRDAVVNGAQWGFEHFVKTDAWKPDKNNIPVQRFIARMRARRALELAAAEADRAAGREPGPPLFEIPEPGERFSYVIVATDSAFDLHGRKADPKKGDRMEFARAARALGLEIDVAFYMVSYVVGLCARFVCGEPAFQAAGDDAAAWRAAKKALETFVRAAGVGADAGTLRRRGIAYQRAFKQATASAREALAARVGAVAAETLQGRWIDFEVLVESCEAGAQVEGLLASARALANIVVGGSDAQAARNVAVCQAIGIGADGRDVRSRGDGRPGRAAARLYTVGPAAGRRRPTGAAMALGSALDQCEASIRSALAAAIPAAAEVAARYEASLARLIYAQRLSEHNANGELGAPIPGDVGLPAASGARPPALLPPPAPAPAPSPAAPPAADAPAELLGITPEDRAPLLALQRQWFLAVGVLIARSRNASLASHLARLKELRLNVGAPPAADREKAAAAAAERLYRDADA